VSLQFSRVAVVGALLMVPACTAMREVQPAQFIPQHEPALVWVTTTSEAVIAVAHPRIDGDTLRGLWTGLRKPLAIPLNGVQTVHARASSPVRTAVLVGAVGLVGGGLVWTLTRRSAGLAGTPCDPLADPEACSY